MPIKTTEGGKRLIFSPIPDPNKRFSDITFCTEIQQWIMLCNTCGIF